tara:strand:+ start:2400 stop:2540 length:141 start_codon:yes stop_codon:yes gene_type:complete
MTDENIRNDRQMNSGFASKAGERMEMVLIEQDAQKDDPAAGRHADK